MILAHNQFPLLKKLIAFLDGDDGDIFLHIDAKVRDLDPEEFLSIPKKSRLVMTDRVSVSWGDFSMVEAEYALLRAAVPGGYDYYHLLSGVDVPLKSRAYIRLFFEENNNINYVNFLAPEISRENRWRVRFYYPFQPLNIRRSWLRKGLRDLSAGVQLLAGVDRTRNTPADLVFQKGTQWFDITRDLAEYLLAREEDVRQIFRLTYCPDELFVQTMVASSSFRNTLLPTAFDGKHRNCCRYIDWERGSPYVFTDEDLETLIHTDPGCLFARKFDYSRWPGIVDRLYATLDP